MDALQSSGRAVTKIWLEPPVSIHPAVTRAIAGFDAVTIGPGSFYTSLMPIFLVRGVADALKNMKGPVILVANLLTEGQGMSGFTAADAVSWIERTIDRPIDVVITNNKWPGRAVLDRYAVEVDDDSRVIVDLGDLSEGGRGINPHLPGTATPAAVPR